MSFTPGKDSQGPGIIKCIQDAWGTQARATCLPVKAGESCQHSKNLLSKDRTCLSLLAFHL